MENRIREDYFATIIYGHLVKKYQSNVQDIASLGRDIDTWSKKFYLSALDREGTVEGFKLRIQELENENEFLFAVFKLLDAEYSIDKESIKKDGNVHD